MASSSRSSSLRGVCAVVEAERRAVRLMAGTLKLLTGSVLLSADLEIAATGGTSTRKSGPGDPSGSSRRSPPPPPLRRLKTAATASRRRMSIQRPWRSGSCHPWSPSPSDRHPPTPASKGRRKESRGSKAAERPSKSVLRPCGTLLPMPKWWRSPCCAFRRRNIGAPVPVCQRSERTCHPLSRLPRSQRKRRQRCPLAWPCERRTSPRSWRSGRR